MSKEKALATKEPTAIAASTDLSAWGESPMSARDIVIPKILPMQGLSTLVTDGNAKFGEFRDSVSGNLLGSIDKPLDFIPFHLEKKWVISSRKAGVDEKFEFEQYEDVTADNINKYPFTQVIGDREFKYEYNMQFYVLLPSDTSMPYVLSFKSTSTRAGKVLSTQMYVRNRGAGLNPAAYVMELSGKKEKNEKGAFVVMEVKPKERTSDELMQECLMWSKTIRSGNTRVAEEATSAPDSAYAQEDVKF